MKHQSRCSVAQIYLFDFTRIWVSTRSTLRLMSLIQCERCILRQQRAVHSLFG